LTHFCAEPKIDQGAFRNALCSKGFQQIVMAHSASSHERELQDYRNVAVGHHQPAPAWLLSSLLHASLFLLLAIALRSHPRGASLEPDRTTGITLVRDVDGQREYYQEAADATGYDDDSASKNLELLAKVLPAETELAVDLSGVLPTAAEGLSETDVDGIADVESALQGTKRGSGTGVSGDVSTAVFGVVGTGTRFVYVFDRSGSMDGFGGRPLRAAKSDLLASLNDLERIHQFQIIFYNERPRVFNPTGGTPELVWGDEASKQLAQRFVKGITAAGGTQHMQALSLALGMRPDVIFFLTDADEPQLTQDDLLRVRRLNRGTSIHAIEFGYGPERSGVKFLEQLARQNQGEHVYVDVAKLDRRNQ
jgi:hypothetical protein